MKVFDGEPNTVTPKMNEYITAASTGIDSVSKAVEEFITSSNSDSKLRGEDFNRVRYHMQAYCDALDNATKLLKDLPDIVSSANSTMQSYCDKNNWKAPADEDNIPEAQTQYDKWTQIYNDRVANRCTGCVTVEDEHGNYIRTDHPGGPYHEDDIQEAWTEMKIWENRLRYLQQMNPTDTGAFNNYNEKILEITTQTNARCNDIEVMTISDALNKISNDSSLSNDEKIKSILGSVNYPNYVETDKTRGNWFDKITSWWSNVFDAGPSSDATGADVDKIVSVVSNLPH